jgi:hypothetical protein
MSLRVANETVEYLANNDELSVTVDDGHCPQRGVALHPGQALER